MGILSTAATKIENATEAAYTKVKGLITPAVEAELSADAEQLVALAVADLAAGKSPAAVLVDVIAKAKAIGVAEYRKTLAATIRATAAPIQTATVATPASVATAPSPAPAAPPKS